MDSSNIIVQGAGHIMGVNLNKEPKEAAKCALFEDQYGNYYCTASLIPLREWLDSYGCTDYIFI